MNTEYAIIEGARVVNVAVAPVGWGGGIPIGDMDEMPGIGWGYDGANFIKPAPAVIVPGNDARIITNLAFDLRFTASERAAIEVASMDNPSASEQERLQSAHIRVNLSRANKAAFTNLDDPITRSGVELLEHFGLLADGRALEILDSAVMDSERP